MKSTKLMVAFIATFILTALLVGAIGYFLSDDMTYREVMQQTGMFLFLLIFGWIPAVIVCADLDKILK